MRGSNLTNWPYLYEVHDDICDPEFIVVFDDVRTTGSHYKAGRVGPVRGLSRRSDRRLFLARVERPVYVETRATSCRPASSSGPELHHRRWWCAYTCG